MSKIEELLRSVCVVDVESTSDQPDTCDVIELATGTLNHVKDWETVSEHFKPPIPIPAASAEKHFITDQMVMNCREFSTSYSSFDEIATKSKYFVAHNAQYDRTAIVNSYTRSGIVPSSSISDPARWLCTLDFAKVLFHGELELPAYRLGFLWFFLELHTSCTRKIIPHQADSDIYMAGRLFEFLVNAAIDLGKIDANKDIGPQVRKLIDDGFVYTTWPYGKHKGTPMNQVPKDYLQWALSNMSNLDPSSGSFDKSLYNSIKGVTK